MTHSKPFRLGIDLGGTKIEALVLDATGAERWRERVATPRESADAICDAIAALVGRAERALGASCTVGIGTPGSLSPRTGLLRGSNTVVLNGQPVQQMLEARLARPVRIANDANCFALSEAVDGAGVGAAGVFGAILGTGVGAGVVINGAIVNGVHGIGGEWGHNPLPWPADDELPERGAHRCYCGKDSCIETWLSGTGIQRHFTDGTVPAAEIVKRAERGDAAAEAYLQRVEDRMARAFATIINVLDPEVVVLGGGASNIERLYRNVPRLLPKYVFSEYVATRFVRNVHGDSSGVRGAAWLW
ncbi:MAG: ROK family protein [Burkholderiales bacterium]|nr:ROK family protein [Burkholderiales bacterium]